MKMRRLLTLIAALLLAVWSAPTAAAASPVQVHLRIEGAAKNLYNNRALTVSSITPTVADVLNGLAGADDAPAVTLGGEAGALRVCAVNNLSENSLQSPFQDVWSVRLNGQNITSGLDTTPVHAGDDLIVFYGDMSLMQYPIIDLSHMLTDGVIRFTSSDSQQPASGNVTPGSPITGATVTWDGMIYITDPNGEIIIDSTGAGVRHFVQIERYYANGLPTVLRLPPDDVIQYGFRDVSTSAWYYNDVMTIADRHLMSGISLDAFGPDTPLSRAMFVTILGRLAGADVDQTAETGFSDVVADGWSAGYIAWAASEGLVSGGSDGTFRPAAAITREQIAVLLYRFGGLLGYNLDTPDKVTAEYTDISSVSPYAAQAVTWAVNKGILGGSGGRLNPKSSATRAETAAVLHRFLQLYES
ncbi:S-layer homology domain-containing protein [Oscillospiraceae bacterium WX1]